MGSLCSGKPTQRGFSPVEPDMGASLSCACKGEVCSMLESLVWVSNVSPVRKLVVRSLLYPGISSRFWAHTPA